MTLKFWTNIVKQNWNIDVTLEKLVGEYDLNFLAKSNNNKYIVKVMRTECSAAFISAQCSILDHLNNCDAPIPKIIKSTSAKDFITVKDETGANRIVWIISAFDGDVYANNKAKPQNLVTEIGKNLAFIDLAMQNFDHEYLHQSDDELMKWNLSQASWIKSKYENLFDENRTQIVANIIGGFEQTKNILNNLPKQAIHNDLNDYNILINKHQGGKQSLSGIIDFGDMVFDAKILNLAICAAYLILDVDKPL
ncbi:MAG: phosphotransferase, partial [Rhizobiales bacterium]|nr:phosphotransferase [Hyphomicrobiales bacterium]